MVDPHGTEHILNVNIGAVEALNAIGAPPDSWPEQLANAGGKVAYARLLEMEGKLSQEAQGLSPAGGYDESRLQLLCSALLFSINLTEHQLNRLASQCARFINGDNVLGAALVVRSMLEHHAVAAELNKKLREVWDRIEKAWPNRERILDSLGVVEKQIARVLAGSPGTAEGHAAWFSLWQESVRVYNVMGPTKSLDAQQPGHLKTYGLLSHIVHGSVCTGGDLLGEGGFAAGRRTIAQITLILGRLLTTHELLYRQADRKSTRLNSSHLKLSRMPSSA